MIISKLGGHNKFLVFEEGSQTKQEVADCIPPIKFTQKAVKLVAQLEIPNSAGLFIEDENGRIHRVGYMFYTQNEIDKLMLPEIQLPKPNMTIEDALIALVKYAPKYVEMSDSGGMFSLSDEYTKAREILGADTALKVLEDAANIYKSRK